MNDTQNGNAAVCSFPHTFDCPSSAYDKDGRLTFSGTLLTMEDCSFENWFEGKTPQMRNWGKSILLRWREAGYPSLGECPPCGGSEVHLLEFALGMMVGACVTLANDKLSGGDNKPL